MKNLFTIALLGMLSSNLYAATQFACDGSYDDGAGYTNSLYGDFLDGKVANLEVMFGDGPYRPNLKEISPLKWFDANPNSDISISIASDLKSATMIYPHWTDGMVVDQMTCYFID
jgi:hypothetical protein